MSGSMVAVNRANPDVSERQIKQLVKDEKVGGLLDYAIGHSFDPNELDPSNKTGRGALGNLSDLDDRGGYGLTHTKGYDLVAIGRIPKNCLTTFSESDAILKCFQYDELFVGKQSDFEDICDELTGHNAGKPLFEAEDQLADLIIDRFIEIERTGEL